MSDREFDNYLTLLAGLLRLDGKQRGAIADELRSHLEDRLEELVARGVCRDEAIQQALAEFGDAAGLAGQFVAISRNRKRRWLMRVMTFSVAAILLLAAGLAILWPGRNAAPGLASAVAQNPKDANPFTPLVPTAKADATKAKPQPAAKASAAVQRIEQELERTTDLDMVEMPLKDVMLYLSEKHMIPIVLKAKKLEEASVAPDTAITKRLRGIRLRSALNIVLEELELTFLVKDEVLQITTLRDANAMTEIRIYDCRDILAMPAPGNKKGAAAAPGESEGGAGSPQATVEIPSSFGGGYGSGYGGMGSGMGFVREHDQRAERLMMIITTNVDPHSWQGAAGGMMPSGGDGGYGQATAVSQGGGSISEYNGLIVITQTAQTHKKIEHLLDMLREAAELEARMGRVVR